MRNQVQTKTPKIIYSWKNQPLAHQAPFKENLKIYRKNTSILPQAGMLSKRTPVPSHYNGVRRFHGSQPTASRDHKFPVPTTQSRTITNSAFGGRPYGGGI